MPARTSVVSNWGAVIATQNLPKGAEMDLVRNLPRIDRSRFKIVVWPFAWRGEMGALRAHWKPILVLGITNSALPFVLFSYALLSITASLTSIFNAA